MKYAKRKISRVTQSPLNPVIWFLDLECGHEVRVVQKKRPAKVSITRDKATGESLIGPRRILCPTCDGRHP
jgi:hypothetical protein